jgi:hypothetical protein
MNAIWYLVILYYGGGGITYIPQTDQAMCQKNATYIESSAQVHAFCVSGRPQ